MANVTQRTKMHIEKPEDRKKNYLPFIARYSEEEVKEEASRCLNCPKPSCMEGCPINNQIPRFMQSVKEGNYQEAYEIIKERSCLSAICGSICPHENQCEGHCIRNKIDEPLSIGAVERFVSEWAINNGLLKATSVSSNNKKVACIGSGPASIACAMKLAEAGFEVVIYEDKEYVGGVLEWGIPSYRLPHEDVQAYINRLLELGVTIHTNTNILENNSFNEMRNEYDAIFIGTGSPISNRMNVEGEDLEGIYDAYTFLKEINLQTVDDEGRKYLPECGKNVVVCGGGNVAMDAARNAVRLPQVETVTILYRRSEEEMPACKEELELAKEEGITFMTLQTPVEFHGENGKVTEAECAIMELGEPDESGRRSPVESDKPHAIVKCDTVVKALGFSNDPNLFSELDKNDRGSIIVDDNLQTSLENVYAGGDVVTGAKTVVAAMKAGMLAAQSIIQKLND